MSSWAQALHSTRYIAQPVKPRLQAGAHLLCRHPWAPIGPRGGHLAADPFAVPRLRQLLVGQALQQHHLPRAMSLRQALGEAAASRTPVFDQQPGYAQA